MEIVLLEDVKALGKKGQIVKVNDGYARNFILPKKLGVEATSKNLNDLKLQKANAEKVAAEQLAAAKELAEKIEKLTVTLKMKAGEGGKAFGSVSSKEIAAAAADRGDRVAAARPVEAGVGDDALDERAGRGDDGDDDLAVRAADLRLPH